MHPSSRLQKGRRPEINIKHFGRMVAVAAAFALFVTSFAVLSKPEKAYAMVSVDREKAVEVVLNQKNRVKEADSKNDSLTREEKKKIKGEKVETIKNYFSQDLSDKETIIVGYALEEDGNLKRSVQHCRNVWKSIWYGTFTLPSGDKEDVENAKKAGKIWEYSGRADINRRRFQQSGK